MSYNYSNTANSGYGMIGSNTFNGNTYSQGIPNNIYTAPNGTYGAPRLGAIDSIFGSTNSQFVPSGPNIKVTDKYIQVINPAGNNATYNKSTGSWDSWIG